MNLDEAIQAHAAWKVKLAAYIQRPDRSIAAAEAGRDDSCPLGEWLHGEARRKFGDLPEYQALVAEHARFHSCIGKAVGQLNCGMLADEEQLLGKDGELSSLSHRVVQLIRSLKAKVAAV